METNPFDAQSVVGLTFEEALVVATNNGYVIRVSSRDGDICVGIRDYRTDRLNVSLTENVVTSVTVA